MPEQIYKDKIKKKITIKDYNGKLLKFTQKILNFLIYSQANIPRKSASKGVIMYHHLKYFCKNNSINNITFTICCSMKILAHMSITATTSTTFKYFII